MRDIWQHVTRVSCQATEQHHYAAQSTDLERELPYPEAASSKAPFNFLNVGPYCYFLTMSIAVPLCAIPGGHWCPIGLVPYL